VKRREFITLFGGAAAGGPFAARAQQSEQKRRVGVLMGLSADDVQAQNRIAAFVQGLQQLGWTDGRNLQIDYRRGAGDSDLTRRYAADLVALAPDVILASGGTVVGGCCRRPVPSQSCSRKPLIRSPPASSQAWRGRAAMPPGLPPPNTASAGNGWSCSKRSRRA
jgi:hypothetical protein